MTTFFTSGTGPWHLQTPQVNGCTSLKTHTAAVKALAWCPFQGNLLASGGGGGDRCIKFWNTHRCMLELSRHRISGLLFAVEQERAGAAKLTWLHSKPIDLVEVALNGQNGRAHWAHLQRSFHGSGNHLICPHLVDILFIYSLSNSNDIWNSENAESRWVHSGICSWG